MEALTTAKAVIVRMPESVERFDGNMRRWLDRMEVDEMIVREERQRGRKGSTQTVAFSSAPELVLIDDDTELYFVGHGDQFGFTEGEDAGQIAAWIRARSRKIPVQNLKVKLVTCNAAGSDYSNTPATESVVFGLAQALRGVARGRVVGFRGYLLSVPETKMVYPKEPGKDLCKGLLDSQVKQLTDLRAMILADLAACVVSNPSEGALDLAWWLAVRNSLRGEEVDLAALQERLGKLHLKGHAFVEGVRSCIDKGIKWPSQQRKETYDFENLIFDFGRANQAAKGQHEATCAQAAKCILRWEAFIVEATKAEWTRRKQLLAESYAKQLMMEKGKDDPLKAETKESGKKMLARAEFKIPE